MSPIIATASSKVDFPLPFGPTRTWNAPSATSTSRSDRNPRACKRSCGGCRSVLATLVIVIARLPTATLQRARSVAPDVEPEPTPTLAPEVWRRADLSPAPSSSCTRPALGRIRDRVVECPRVGRSLHKRRRRRDGLRAAMGRRAAAGRLLDGRHVSTDPPGHSGLPKRHMRRGALDSVP